VAHKPYRNPFFFLLVLVGILFVVTAFAYGYMAFQSLHASPAEIALNANHPLWVWLNVHGTTAILVELALLGLFTVAAMGTDRYWDVQQKRKAESGKPTS